MRAWLAIVVPTWLVLALCTYWEPVLGDGWGHFYYQHWAGISPSSLWFAAKDNYLHMNPRLGQVFTLLLYTPGPWHVIVTPLVELGLIYLLTALALGHWPRRDDALTFATILALVVTCTPLIGPMLFYRPFTGNYLYGLVLGVAFLVPYRMHVEAPRTGWWRVPAMFVLGAAAGLCNEHTGPAFLALAVAAMVHARRPATSAARQSPAASTSGWMIAGAVGLLAGGLALYFAPGQSQRYSGLAQQASLLGRIAQRGAGNFAIVGHFLKYMAFALPWLALGVRKKPDRITIVLLAGAFAIVLTLLASPKQGDRLYFAAIALACAAIARWIVPDVRSRVAAWALAAVASAYVGVRCVETYRVIGPEFTERLAAIEHAVPKSTITVRRYSRTHSHWFLGDDFDAPNKRNEVAVDYDLTAIELSGQGQRDATPPVSDPEMP